LAEPSFDRGCFERLLTTRWLGRRSVVHAELSSTNDAAWEALAAGAPDGLVVVADFQTRGRGRGGRAWRSAPRKGLALSLLLRRGCERPALGVVPLLSGLALALGLDRLGIPARLKWPNDLLLGERKLAGVLVESRGPSSIGTVDAPAVVIGVGVNVSQRAEDFPPELLRPESGAAHPATSLALEGHDTTREAVAAEWLNAFEPLWVELGERGREPILDAWRCRASFWGEEVRVRTASGVITGVARTLDGDGRLVLELESGERIAVLAGDLEPAAPRQPSPR
jgi:BirA family biotin operon repressor/biotin-[acetyl-CoA-carboxylase] ligase